MTKRLTLLLLAAQISVVLDAAEPIRVTARRGTITAYIEPPSLDSRIYAFPRVVFPDSAGEFSRAQIPFDLRTSQRLSGPFRASIKFGIETARDRFDQRRLVAEILQAGLGLKPRNPDDQQIIDRYQLDTPAARRVTAELIVGGEVIDQRSSSGEACLAPYTDWEFAPNNLTAEQLDAISYRNFQIRVVFYVPLSTFQSLHAHVTYDELTKGVYEGFFRSVERAKKSGFKIGFIDLQQNSYSASQTETSRNDARSLFSATEVIVGRDITSDLLLQKLESLLFDRLTEAQFRERHAALAFSDLGKRYPEVAAISKRYIEALDANDYKASIGALTQLKGSNQNAVLGFLTAGLGVTIGGSEGTLEYRSVKRIDANSKEERDFSAILFESATVAEQFQYGPFDDNSYEKLPKKTR